MTDMARIGPNAILQLVPVLDNAIGATRRQDMFLAARVSLPPPDAGMLAEDQVIRLHRAVADDLPHIAQVVLRQAGLATADYILANRIPKPAQRLVRVLPRPIGARLLARAIAGHAWTFAGSGAFRVVGYQPLTLSIAGNPLAILPGCPWHTAVFERLFSTLVWPDVRVREVACCAAGALACTFRIGPQI